MKKLIATMMTFSLVCIMMFSMTALADDDVVRDAEYVVDSNGTKIYSSGPVNFTAGEIVAAVANAPKEVVESCLSESDHEYKYMATLDIYRCYATDEIRQNIASFATEQGTSTYAYFDAYVIRRNELCNPLDYIPSLTSEVEIILSTPETIDTTVCNAYVVRNHNGVNTLLADTDTDPNTITFKTNLFGAFAVVAAPKEAIITTQPVSTEAVNSATSDKVLDSVPKTGER